MTAVEVRLETSLGVIELALDQVRAPLTTANFLRYVDEGRYTGASFYRAVRREHWTPGREMEIVQGGLALHPERVLPPIVHESPADTGLLNRAGTISMARGTPGTAGSEFFVCLADCPMLDPTSKPTPPHDGLGYAAFGRVTLGFDVLRTIQAQPTLPRAPIEILRGQMLATPVEIVAATRVTSSR